MPTTPPTLDIFIQESREAASPLVATAGGFDRATFPALVTGDSVPVRIRFYQGETNVRHNGQSIIIAAKLKRSDAEPVAVLCTTFAEVQVSTEYAYTGTLDLNTTPLRDAVQGENKALWFEVIVAGTASYQFQTTIRPQVYTGGEADPTSPEGVLIQSAIDAAGAAQATATEAQASADAAVTTANAAADAAAAVASTAAAAVSTANAASATASDASITAASALSTATDAVSTLPQVLSSGQRQQARTNIDTFSKAEVTEFVGEAAGTGAYHFEGLAKVTDTVFSVGYLGGWVTNFVGTAEPVLTEIHRNATTGHTVTNISTADISYIGVDSAGFLIQQATPFSDAQKRDIISLGSIEHPDRATITAVYSTPSLVGGVNNRFESFVRAVGIINMEGNIIAPNAANLTIKRSAGQMWAASSNFSANPKSPDIKAQAAVAPATFYRTTRTAVTAINQTTLDPNNYDLNGVVTAVPNNRWTIQRVYVAADGVMAVAYGQATYTSLANAIDGIATEAFVEPFFKNVVTLRAYICVLKGAQDLANVGEAKFVTAARTGGGTSGGTANDPGAVRFDSAQTLTTAQQSNARVNIGIIPSGGVALAGSDTTATGNGFASSIPVTDFELCVFAKRTDAALTKSAIAGSAANDYLFIGASFENPTWGGLAWKNAGSQQRLTDDFDQTKPFVASFAKVGSTLTGYVNGVAGASPATVSAFLSLDRILGGIIGGYGQFGGSVSAVYVFNRALTTDERAAVMCGELTSAMRASLLAEYRPDSVTASGRWVDTSGNARDLVPGNGITPLAPRNAITRTVKISTTGATVTANTAASIGTITGVAAKDTAAIAAIRAGDALSASWTTSRPANASGLDAHAPTNGTPSVFVHAGATACTVPASTQLNLVHTIS